MATVPDPAAIDPDNAISPAVMLTASSLLVLVRVFPEFKVNVPVPRLNVARPLVVIF